VRGGERKGAEGEEVDECGGETQIKHIDDHLRNSGHLSRIGDHVREGERERDTETPALEQTEAPPCEGERQGGGGCANVS